MPDYFITGTDTGVGKTRTTLALMRAMQDKGETVAGMKPVASGCIRTKQGLRNDDALKILQYYGKQEAQDIDYEIVNPYAFEQPIAPHIAAALSGVTIEIEQIASAFATLKKDFDNVIVEGIGGWCVPLGDELMLADVVKGLDLRVIIVIGLRLGCINHALSSVRAIQADGANLYGWICNQLEPDYAYREETMAVFHSRINAPFLGGLDYMERLDMETTANHVMRGD